MNRRDFLAGGIAAVGLGSSAIRAESGGPAGQFRLKFAPRLGMFKHHAEDLIAQIGFVADQGFRAVEDKWIGRKDVVLQEQLADELERHKLELGAFVGHAGFGKVTFASRDKAVRAEILADMKAAVEVAKRVRARWCTVMPGSCDPKVEWEYQTANVVDNLRYAAEVCEPAGLIMLLEPLNRWNDHPGVFLSRLPQAYEICRAVNSPVCKILDDFYHQQVGEGNLLANVDLAWDEIAYYRIGDNPGRNEPMTGEINFANVFAHLHKRGFTGILGMDHGISRPGKEGEAAVIRAYRECDA